MFIFGIGADPNLIRKKFTVTAWTPLLWTMKASCPWSVSISLKKVKGLISMHFKIGKLHKKVDFLEVPFVAMNMLLGTASISWYIEKISPEAETICSVILIPVAITEAAVKCPAMAVERSATLFDNQWSSKFSQDTICNRPIRQITTKEQTFVRVALSAGVLI